MPIIKLKSADGEILDVDEEVAKTMLEGEWENKQKNRGLSNSEKRRVFWGNVGMQEPQGQGPVAWAPRGILLRESLENLDSQGCIFLHSQKGIIFLSSLLIYPV